jgi:hypothetical protein
VNVQALEAWLRGCRWCRHKKHRGDTIIHPRASVICRIAGETLEGSASEIGFYWLAQRYSTANPQAQKSEAENWIQESRL